MTNTNTDHATEQGLHNLTVIFPVDYSAVKGVYDEICSACPKYPPHIVISHIHNGLVQGQMQMKDWVEIAKEYASFEYRLDKSKGLI